MATKKDTTEISVIEIKTRTIEFCVLGTSPLICNRMSEKAKRELLLPRGKKNAAEKASTLKHNPVEEFKASPYILREGDSLLAALSTWFKQAIGTAALDLPDVQKSKVLRLLWVNEERVCLYGIPKLFMSITRSADMNKTPDVRTRAILQRWACRIAVSYVTPMLREQTVANLLGMAGVTSGVGDWRQEKGSGSYGMFKIVPETDPEYRMLIKTGGRSAQVAAMQNPEPYDEDSAELLTWFHGESKSRGFDVPASDIKPTPDLDRAAEVVAKTRRRRGNGEARA